MKLPRPMLMMVTGPAENLAEIVDAGVRGGVNVVQLRDKSADQAAITAEARRLRNRIDERAILLVNMRRAGAPPALAERLARRGSNRDRARRPITAAGTAALLDIADGIHLPEYAPFVDAPIVGRSVHSVEAAIRAADEGADYILAGTIFPSPSHPNAALAGVELIERICAKVSIPVVAIGGVTPANARSCVDAGAAGIAALSSLMDSSDPASVAAEYWRAIA